jgi:curved DNA-binding protein CbpA
LLNYYQILELANFSSRESVKGAFKRLAFQFHPDRNPDNAEAEERFKQINEAYRVLSDPGRKYRYDELLRTGAASAQQVIINGDSGAKTYYRRPNPDPRYRRRAPPGYIPPARPQNPYLPTNMQMGCIAVGLMVYLFFLVRTALVLYAKVTYDFALEAVAKRNYRQAYDYLQQTVASDPNHYQAFALKGRICAERLFYYFEAAESYTQAIKHAPNFRPEYFLHRGLALSQLRERKMEAHFDFGIAAPHYARDLASLGLIAEAYHDRLRNYDKALEYYQKMVALAPKNPKLHQTMGQVLILLDRYDKAIDSFGKALVLDNQNSQLYYQRAICYYYTSDKPRACGDWQRAQKLNPNIRDENLEYFCNYKEG